MKTEHLIRRQLLKAGVLLSTALILDIDPLEATPPAGKTPALAPAEIAAIEAAIGKKGMYKKAKETHTTPLPRNDLKLTIKDQPVPTPFGFRGWESIKKTLDAKSA